MCSIANIASDLLPCPLPFRITLRITVQLYHKHAPKTCRNFLELSRRGYYNGTKFHRVIKDFMAQGGDPTGTGRGGESIYGAKFEDEITRELKHTGAGVLSMANSGPNTNGSQFFLTLAPTPWLDGKHTIFGRVSHGMDVLKRLGNVQADRTDRPIHDVKIIKAVYHCQMPIGQESLLQQGKAQVLLPHPVEDVTPVPVPSLLHAAPVQSLASAALGDTEGRAAATLLSSVDSLGRTIVSTFSSSSVTPDSLCHLAPSPCGITESGPCCTAISVTGPSTIRVATSCFFPRSVDLHDPASLSPASPLRTFRLPFPPAAVGFLGGTERGRGGGKRRGGEMEGEGEGNAVEGVRLLAVCEGPQLSIWDERAAENGGCIQRITVSPAAEPLYALASTGEGRAGLVRRAEKGRGKGGRGQGGKGGEWGGIEAGGRGRAQPSREKVNQQNKEQQNRVQQNREQQNGIEGVSRKDVGFAHREEDSGLDGRGVLGERGGGEGGGAGEAEGEAAAAAEAEAAGEGGKGASRVHQSFRGDSAWCGIARVSDF
ncbi:unnamed protein product [Closterium sp. Naga37s-1]|nr:unnamed protein product [Closterium sp. Naga37s-1]